VALGGVGVWTSTCPCINIPGFMLLGDVQNAPVTDSRFVNDIPLCQIQVYAGPMPHAVNLNCMATENGDLFLSCGACDRKFWGRHVEDGAHGRLRLKGQVYSVDFTHVKDPAVTERAWTARVKKLQVYSGGRYNPVPPPGAKPTPGWQAIQLRSAVD
jgi:hypothetical protein